ncbi:adenine nucleotide alpha hydrolase [Fusarium denticulatum]|uniref:Adenine nucleotide alpha hydrolase n=1 Tax=Fusarium denticulatum TaxID=48507 RepID=A0A8H5TXQ5_9HYPO|nr:adenine nucleotide alpha hydrolase [Fusarium denticulatum]
MKTRSGTDTHEDNATARGHKRQSSKTDSAPEPKTKQAKTSEARPSTPEGQKPTLTEKDLEFDFDHSQIRDPRATPGRFHIPKHRNKHTDPLESFYDLHRCHRKGPDGSPTYDSAGFQLDYEKVAKWMKPVAYNKKSMVNGMERHLKRDEEETKKIYDCFFIDGKGPEGEDGSIQVMD